MDNIQENLGLRVRSLRIAAGITQEQLAEKAGLSLKHLGELERGRSNPTLSSLHALATGLGVSMAALFDFEGIDVPPDIAKKSLCDAVENASDKERQTMLRILLALKGDLNFWPLTDSESY